METGNGCRAMRLSRADHEDMFDPILCPMIVESNSISGNRRMAVGRQPGRRKTTSRDRVPWAVSGGSWCPIVVNAPSSDRRDLHAGERDETDAGIMNDARVSSSLRSWLLIGDAVGTGGMP